MTSKITTEIFIQRAREKHGDKYDYSKAEYVNKHTKVCIICKDHGEFWQRAYIHLMGCGCSQCGLEKNAKKLRLWTRERCLMEAKKYTSRGAFKKGCPIGYSNAREKGWLEEYTWFAAPQKKVNKGYWTYETCYREAIKYTSKAEFVANNNGAYQAACKNHWIGIFTWLMPAFRWTPELCEKEARKYKSKKEFRQKNSAAYQYATKNRLLSTYTWLEEYKKPNDYWTEERCRNEAAKYETKIDFLRGNPSAHSAAVRNGWLITYDWFNNEHFDIRGKIDCVYAYIFEQTKAVYVGRTLMRRIKKRDYEHIFNDTNDAVARYAESLHCPVPSMTILEIDLTLAEGQEKEGFWVRTYQEQGYTILNRAATGLGIGSLGAIDQGKWNREACEELAKQVTSCAELKRLNASAYSAARQNGWLKDYIWFVAKWRPRWDYESCKTESLRYTTRKDFQKFSPSAYRKAWKMKWLDDFIWLAYREIQPSKHWDNYDNCYVEAQKYNSRSEFQHSCQGAYNKARINGWIADYTWFKELTKPNGYWNKETCFEEAKKWKTATEFGRNAVRAYQLARLNGWIRDYIWFEKPFIWTYNLCKEEAKKYSKRIEFKKEQPGAYTKSRVKGWLDEFFPKNNNGIM